MIAPRPSAVSASEPLDAATPGQALGPALSRPSTLRLRNPANEQASAEAPGPFEVAGKHVYLLGVGGSGMSGMARMLAARGAIVRGSDPTPTDITKALAESGIMVDLDQSRPWLPDFCDLIVASAAIKTDNPQYIEAVRRGVPVLTYAQALGRCMAGRTGVCIAGTHGKSTTTAMLSCVLSDAGIDPTTILGATCQQLAGSGAGTNTGFRLGADVIAVGPHTGRPGVLLAEACEFNRSFHNYSPVVAAITSVEADHLDIYGTLDAVVAAFGKFAANVAPASEGGLLLIAHSNAHRREVTSGVKARVQTIGFHPDSDWYVTYEAGPRRVHLHGPDKRPLVTFTMQMPGSHNAMNAATAAAIALHLGATPDTVRRSLSAFRGLDRRNQMLGVWRGPGFKQGQGVRVYDDYGHHPTEVETTLRALRQFEQPEALGGRLVCVFQPHQHSRTRHLLGEFANSFGAADLVIVPHIYFVRDSAEERTKVTAGDLVDKLREKGVQATHIYPFEAIVHHLRQVLRPNDLLVVMGAGPVNEVAQGLLATSEA